MRATFTPIIALLLGVLFLITGHGMQFTLIPLRAAAESWSPLAIGTIGSAYFVGFVVGCLTAPYAILRVGHIRTFAALVALASATTLVQALVVTVTGWIVFRVVIGLCLSGLYMVIESWLNDRASNSNRGTIMSAYVVISFVATGVGQFMVTMAPPTAFTLFAVAAVAISLATIPVAFTNAPQPAPITLVRFRPRELYRSSPVGMVGVVVFGLATGAFWSLAAVYVVGAGLSVREAAVFTGLVTVGGALAQWPAGRISDRVDRRLVMIVLLLAGASVALLLAFLPLAGHLWVVLALLLGATTFPVYSVAAAHAYDHAEPGNYVETAAGVLLANGLGAIVGPLAASVLMQSTSPSALFVFIAGVQVGLVIFVLSRLLLRAAPTEAEKTGFDLAATAPMGAVIVPEIIDPSNANVAVPPVAMARTEPHTKRSERKGDQGGEQNRN